MKRIGVISDTHMRGYDPAFAALLARVFAGVDMILHAGDITSLAVLDALDAPQVLAVAGNMDQGPTSANLPSRRIITVEGLRIGLTHGWGPREGLARRVAESFAADDVRCVVFGHSHQPTNLELGGVLLFNPGSAMAGQDGGTVGVLEVDRQITGSIINL